MFQQLGELLMGLEGFLHNGSIVFIQYKTSQWYNTILQPLDFV